VWSFPSLLHWHKNFFNHYAAYTWFLLYLFSVYFLFRETKLSDTMVYKLVAYILFFVFIYSLFESLFHIYGVDIGSYIPRYDREEYKFWTPFFFFRARGFNYESANLAMYFNVAFPFLFVYSMSNLKKALLFLIWFLSLLLTFSSVHLFLFFIFIFILFISNIKLKINLLLFIIFIF